MIFRFSLRLFLLIVLLLRQSPTPILVSANPILPITHEWHEADYYARQAKEWQQNAETDACNTMAWYHYYLAAHYANLFDYQPAFNLDKIHKKAEVALTEKDFALHYIRIRRTHNTEERWVNLLAAHQSAPDRKEAYGGMAVYHIMNGEHEKAKEFLAKLDARLPFPRGVIDWNQNQLNSVAQNGLLITYGDNDTYATWLLQYVYGIRTDIQVVNLPLLLNYPEYRNQICQALGLVVPDLNTPNPERTAFQMLVKCKRPVYIGVGGNEALIEAEADQLYLTGLAFRYSLEPFNNLGILLNNYQQKWRLEGLKFPFDNEARRRVVDQLERNYLPAFFELYNYFKDNKPTEAEKLKNYIYSIAENNDLGHVIDDYFRPEPPQLASQEADLKAKQILKGMVFIPAGTYQDFVGEEGIAEWPNFKAYQQEPVNTVAINSFYLQATEVSNGDYQLFLEDLLRQRKFEYIDTVSIADFDYNSVLPESLRATKINEFYNQGQASLEEHPVTNISHKAAELYAIWLTQVYNQDPKRKDGRKVRFRLARAEEIAYASRGGLEKVPFSWGGFGVNNAKGCYLGNFNTLLEEYPDESSAVTLKDYYSKAYIDRYEAGEEPECGSDDGGYLTVPVDAYYPNSFGLYNMTGNAAEMINEEGVDTGGSWYDHAADLEIGRLKQRVQPHPAVGFRLVMEYID